MRADYRIWGRSACPSAFTEACCLSGLPHTPGLLLRAAPGKHLTTLTAHIQGASGVRTPVMRVIGEEGGVPCEESNSLKISGRWTGALAKATALGACTLGKSSSHLLPPFHRPLTSERDSPAVSSPGVLALFPDQHPGIEPTSWSWPSIHHPGWKS